MDSQNATDGSTVNSQFFTAIAQNLNDSLGKALSLTFTPITGSNLFNWYYQSNDLFNLATYNYVNRRLAPDPNTPGSVSFVGTWSSDYLSVLGNITYALDAADQQALQAANTTAAAEGDAVVAAYETAYGTITADMIKAAQASAPSIGTKIDYVIQWVVNWVWSCASAPSAKSGPINAWTVSDLMGALGCLPASGQAMMPLIAQYLDQTNSVASLIGAENLAMARLRSVRSHTGTPTMAAQDAKGNKATVLQWSIAQSTGQLNSSLNPSPPPGNPSAVGVDMTATFADARTLKVDVRGHGIGWVPLGDFFGIEGSGSTHYSLDKFVDNSATISVDIRYPNPTLFTLTPQHWAEETATGWFDPTLIEQAYTNKNGSATGYLFSPAPQFDLAPGGEFGRASNLVISQLPIISITTGTSSFNDSSQVFEQQSSWGVTFLGIPIASMSESTYQSHVTRDDKAGTTTVTFTPPPMTGAPFELLSWVLGASIAYPTTGA